MIMWDFVNVTMVNRVSHSFCKYNDLGNTWYYFTANVYSVKESMNESLCTPKHQNNYTVQCYCYTILVMPSEILAILLINIGEKWHIFFISITKIREMYRILNFLFATKAKKYTKVFKDHTLIDSWGI